MSGCLPLLIQFPILFGLIDVIYKPLTHIAHLSADTIEKMREIAEKAGGILGANTYAQEIDIINALNSGKASLFTGQIGADVIEKAQHIDLNFLGINLGERPVWAFNLLVLIPILSGITSLLVSIYSMKVNQAAQGEQAGGGAMKGMMYIMPLFSVFFAFQVPALGVAHRLDGGDPGGHFSRLAAGEKNGHQGKQGGGRKNDRVH